MQASIEGAHQISSDTMAPIVAPMIGGMVPSTIDALIITPLIFYIMQLRA